MRDNKYDDGPNLLCAIQECLFERRNKQVFLNLSVGQRSTKQILPMLKISYEVNHIEEWGGDPTNIMKRRWNGKWLYQVSTGEGKKLFKTRREAQMWLVNFSHVVTGHYLSVLDVLAEYGKLVLMIAPWCSTMSNKNAETVIWEKSIEFAYQANHRFRHKGTGMKSCSAVASDCMRLTGLYNKVSHSLEGHKINLQRTEHIVYERMVMQLIARCQRMKADLKTAQIDGWEEVKEQKYGDAMLTILKAA